MVERFDFQKFFDMLELYGQSEDEDLSSSDHHPGLNLGFHEDFNPSDGHTEKLPGNVSLNLTRVPTGSFIMGSPASKGESCEQPQHPVRVPFFWISQTPITQAQWQAVASLPKVKTDLSPNPSRFKGHNLPVEKVSWYEALEFCHRLAKHTGGEYRLPRESEWEYACRAETQTPYHFDQTISTYLANYNGKNPYSPEPTGVYRRKTTPVASFNQPNRLGLHDMHGNVCEWRLDSWHPDYNGAPDDGQTWKGEAFSRLKVLRGGSWALFSNQVRSASRTCASPSFQAPDIGFSMDFHAKKSP